MRVKTLLMTTILAGAAFATPALAQNYSSPWSFSSSIGTEVSVSGDVIAAGNSNSINMATLNTNLVGQQVLRMRGRTYDDVYDKGLKSTFEVRYALSDLAEVFGSIGFLKAEAKANVDLGCLADAAAPTTCVAGLRGQVSDLKQTALEIGYRQWFGVGLFTDAIRPYYAVRAGAVKTDAIHAYVATGANGLGHWRLYDDTYSYSTQADLGATYTITDSMELGAEVGVRYVSKLDQIEADFGALGLGGINDKSNQVTIPISLKLNAVF